MRDEWMLNMQEVLKRIGVSRSTLYKLMERGEFPWGTPITERRKAWPRSEVRGFLYRRIAEGLYNPQSNGPKPPAPHSVDGRQGVSQLSRATDTPAARSYELECWSPSDDALETLNPEGFVLAPEADSRVLEALSPSPPQAIAMAASGSTVLVTTTASADVGAMDSTPALASDLSEVRRLHFRNLLMGGDSLPEGEA